MSEIKVKITPEMRQEARQKLKENYQIRQWPWDPPIPVTDFVLAILCRNAGYRFVNAITDQRPMDERNILKH